MPPQKAKADYELEYSHGDMKRKYICNGKGLSLNEKRG